MIELKNGKTVVGAVKVPGEMGGYIVLASDGYEMVSWMADEEGNCYWGRYGDTAVDSFIDRIRRYYSND